MDTPATHGGRRPGAGAKRRPPSTDAARYTAARAMKEEALAKLRTLEAQEKAQELAPVQLLQEVLSRAVVMVGARLDEIPARLRRECPELTATHLLIIEQTITRVRSEIAGATLD